MTTFVVYFIESQILFANSDAKFFDEIATSNAATERKENHARKPVFLAR